MQAVGAPAQLSTISVFYKQRNNFFFPVTSYALPTVLLRVPLSVATGIIYTALTYFVVGFAPDVGRCDPGAASLAIPASSTRPSSTSWSASHQMSAGVVRQQPCLQQFTPP